MSASELAERATTIGAIMSRPVLTVELDETLWDAWQLMAVSGLRHLAVIDDAGACLGVISDRAALAGVPLEPAVLKGRRVRDMLARIPLITVGPDDPPMAAAAKMHDFSVDATPVVEDGRLVGIVSSTDIVAWVAAGS